MHYTYLDWQQGLLPQSLLYPTSCDPDAFHEDPLVRLCNRLLQPVVVVAQMIAALFICSSTRVRDLGLLDQTPGAGALG